MTELSFEYANIYDNMLEAVGSSPRITVEMLTSFWPICGQLFDGDLYVIGRAANGWNKPWEKQETVTPSRRLQILKRTRGYSENQKHCPLLWVAARADNPDYSTSDAAFWRVVKRVTLEGNRDWERAESWASWLCWSNLLKVAPDELRLQPSAALKQVLLPFGVDLIAQEVAEFNPRRILVLTGADWFKPFIPGLGLEVKWRTGFAEGIAVEADRRWVIAKNPTLKSEEALVDEILEAFAGRLGD